MSDAFASSSPEPAPDAQPAPGRSWRTKLIHSDVQVPTGFKSLAPAVHRGSTVVFDRIADTNDMDRLRNGYTYGVHGTPTTRELALRIAEIENAHHTFVLPSGLAAILLVYLVYCKSGSHVLLPDNAYDPSRNIANNLLNNLGIDVEIYDPLIGAGIRDLIRDNTSLIWTESPGSITMEVQDIPAIVAAARERNIPVAIDNTYSAGVMFDAFAHGVDISMQALTKYIGGHSDVLLGSVSVKTEEEKLRIQKVLRLLGQAVSADDCALALRGLQTLALRLDYLERATLDIANWLAQRPEIATVLHPALPSCPGHELWKRDFTGSTSIFSVVFNDDWSVEQINTFIDSLQLFKIGYSWGGTTSLVMSYAGSLLRTTREAPDRLVRFNVGVEDVSDLIADLENALKVAASENTPQLRVAE